MSAHWLECYDSAMAAIGYALAFGLVVMTPKAGDSAPPVSNDGGLDAGNAGRMEK